MILAAAHLIADVKLHHTVFDADHVNVGCIARAVVLFNFRESFTLLFFSLLAENRV
jgi:hypothetical protein